MDKNVNGRLPVEPLTDEEIEEMVPRMVDFDNPHQLISNMFESLVWVVEQNLESTRERSLLVTNLEQAGLWYMQYLHKQYAAVDVDWAKIPEGKSDRPD